MSQEKEARFFRAICSAIDQMEAEKIGPRRVSVKPDAMGMSPDDYRMLVDMAESGGHKITTDGNPTLRGVLVQVLHGYEGPPVFFVDGQIMPVCKAEPEL